MYFCFRQYHMARSSGDHATLNCHRARYGWGFRHEHLKIILRRDRPRSIGPNFAAEVPNLVAYGEK
jgi:hypothetical protein